jgi:hypothetical protein
MIVLEDSKKSQELDVLSANEAELRVERTDISFEDSANGNIRIQVTVHNDGWRRSRPTVMRLESAPLGAFVPWQPLAVLPVPPVAPGGRLTLTTEVPRPRPAPLGDFGRVPPRKILTAVNSPDQSAQPSTGGVLTMLNLLRRGQAVRAAGDGATARTAPLPPDLLELVGQDQPHWAGNINVFIGAHPVERHVAKALRVYAGRTNLAMFVVGDHRKRDAYAFELVGLAPDWEAALYDVSTHRTLVVDPGQPAIQPSEWLEFTGGLVVLATCPPVGCRVGKLDVRVTRRSCGETAIVEFTLELSAQGTGCYVA